MRPTNAFVLRGPGPAVLKFFEEIVAAIADGDPDTSDDAIAASVEAVRIAPGLTPFHREQALAKAVDRLSDAGLLGDYREDPDDDAFQATTRAMIAAGDAVRAAPILRTAF